MLPRTLLKTGLRDLVRRPLHTGLMVLGVALGVAVVTAIDLANESARRSFARSAETVAGRATHQLVGGPRGIPEDLYRRVRVEWGLRASAPVVEGGVVAIDLDRQPLRVLGVDPLAEAPFRSPLEGGLTGGGGLAAWFTAPRSVLVGAGLARRYHLEPGSPLRVQAGDRIEILEVLGVIETGDEGSSAETALDGLLMMDVAAAQDLLGRGGRLSRIDLIATPADVERLTPLLPEGVHLGRASEQAETVGQLSAAFQLNLTALSLLALVVGMFLIYNTVLFSVVQRRTVLGTLRTLGVTGGQVLALILAETALTSAIGTSLGLAMGWLLAQGAVRLVTQTINDLYYTLSVSGAPLTWPGAAKGVALGIGAGLLSAVPPALEAARVEPVTALRPSTTEGAARRWLPWIAGAGVLLGVLGGLGLALWPSSLVASFAGLFGIVLGWALLAPAATVAAMALAGPIAGSVWGCLGRLAAGTVTRSVSRTGVAIAALTVAVSVTIGVGLMIASFRATVLNWLELTLRADIYLAVPGRGGGGDSNVLSRDVPARVAAVAGVGEVETLRAVRVEGDGGEVQLAVTSARQGRSPELYRFTEGNAAAVWARVREDAVVVSEPFAFRHAIPPRGGAVRLRTDRGPHTFPVVGVFYDYTTERGVVLMSRSVYERFWDDRELSSLAVRVREGYGPEAVADALRAALAGTAVQVSVNRRLREEAIKVFDRTFAVTESLRVLAVVVAFIGVWSALMALQLERTRELATLAALGVTPAQLGGLTLLETGLMGATAGLLSLPLGTLLAVILVNVINVRSFGWTMRLQIDPWLFVQALGVSLGAALLACLYPLRRLLAQPVAAGLRQE